MVLKTVVVGIDRSTTALGALRWAVDFADSPDANVTAVSSWEMPYVAKLPGRIQGLPTVEFLTNQCAESLNAVVTDAGADSAITQLVIEGKPGPALVEAAAEADLLVVGRTGQGKRHGIARLAEVVLGSTARHCIHQARVPIATVPAGSQWSRPATVVVGLDGSTSSVAALDWALASLPVDSTLYVVRAFTPWVGDGLSPADLLTDKGLHDAFRHETQIWVNDAITRCEAGDFAKPKVEVAIGNPRDLLTDPGYEVDLIIVGERGHTGLAARVLGSVSDHLVRYAACPVVVVPEPRDSSANAASH